MIYRTNYFFLVSAVAIIGVFSFITIRPTISCAFKNVQIAQTEDISTCSPSKRACIDFRNDTPNPKAEEKLNTKPSTEAKKTESNPLPQEAQTIGYKATNLQQEYTPSNFIIKTGPDAFAHIPTRQELPLPDTQLLPESTPLKILKDRYELTGRQIQSSYQKLVAMGLCPEKLNEAGQKLQGEWNKAHANYLKRKQDIEVTQQLIQQGLIDHDMGQLAIWEMVLPPEAARAMYHQWLQSQDQ